jgi:hypothetical protein
LGILDIFRNKKKAQSGMAQPTLVGSSIFYHEDEFRQIEIIPDDNLSMLKAESERIQRFANEHFDGSGFTDIYIRNHNSEIKLNQRKIDPIELEKILISIGLSRISIVFTGYGQNFRELHKDCIAYSKQNSAIYFDFKGDVVEHIWFTNPWGIDRDRLTDALEKMGHKWNLLLQDWNLVVTVELKDKEAIEGYLKTFDNNQNWIA